MFLNDKRRQETKHLFLRTVDQETPLHAGLNSRRPRPVKFHAQDQAKPSNLLDAGVLLAEFLQSAPKIGPHLLTVFYPTVFQETPEDLPANGAY